MGEKESIQSRFRESNRQLYELSKRIKRQQKQKTGSQDFSRHAFLTDRSNDEYINQTDNNKYKDNWSNNNFDSDRKSGWGHAQDLT